ncbi:MAG: DUF3467 domain-containing protein [Paludibacteraceae bacterium]|nr:DUF3467 domain-containing protein [Candidatus Physcocola equi]MCQ2233225.1 DUF3467 domain-containing protein [Paludibacteraceae bacterium]
MEEQKDPKKAELQLELSADIAEGTYANFSMVGHSPEEFIMDFARIVPSMPKARIKSRVIMTPAQAKRFSAVLRQQIENYERQFGIINENLGRPQGGGPNTTPIPINFNSGMA